MKQFLLLQHCFRLLTFGTITTSDAVRGGHFLLISVGSVKISFNSLCLLLKAVVPHKFCVVSVSLQGSCVSLVSTRQHLISTGHCPHSVYSRSTSVPFTVREYMFVRNYILLCWSCLKPIRLCEHSYSKTETSFSAILMTHYCPCGLNRMNPLHLS